jgi:hypothetical protein
MEIRNKIKEKKVITEKCCPKCKITKDTIDFYRSSRTFDGYGVYCILCAKGKAKDEYNIKKNNNIENKEDNIENKEDDTENKEDNIENKEEKKCNACKIYKNVSEFHKKPKNKNGLQPNCKLCTNAKRREYCEKNKVERNKKRRENALKKLNK